MNRRLDLRLFLCAGKQFKMSIKQAKASFYKSLNLLLSETLMILLLYLIKTFCVPLLLYGSKCLECIHLVMALA